MSSNHKPPVRSPADPALGLDRHRNADGTYDGIGALSEISGIEYDGILAIAEQVKANIAKLSACTGHSFMPMPCGPAKPMYMQRHQCVACGGDIGELTRMRFELTGKISA